MHAELILAGQHMLVVRGGFGQRSWADAEFDDPTYKERYARIGYRIASDHIYAGFDVGRAWDRAHWDSTDAMPAHDGSWFAATTGTGMIGWMLGPVDLGVDYTISDESYFGVYLGMGVWRR